MLLGNLEQPDLLLGRQRGRLTGGGNRHQEIHAARNLAVHQRREGVIINISIFQEGGHQRGAATVKQYILGHIPNNYR